MAENATSVISVRISPRERELLEAAAEQAHTSLSDFVRRRAVIAAETEILERRDVLIPAEAWERFEAWLHEPPKNNPALDRLMAHKPAWEKQ